MSNYINYNGKVVRAGKALITADNRSFRYGDGLFETMKLVNNSIALAAFHFERLWNGMHLMEFDVPAHFTPGYLTTQVLQLCRKNLHQSRARIRMTIFRGNGGLYDPEHLRPNFIIQTWELPASNELLNKAGLDISVYPDARKACDCFSHIKSNNYLPYLMAALHARKQGLNDCLLLNAYGNICDATIANVFLVNCDKVVTPALSEGCVAGVMRRYLLENLHTVGYRPEESTVTVDDLAHAEEVFLTNAVQGIRWVKQCATTHYTNTATLNISNALLKEMR